MVTPKCTSCVSIDQEGPNDDHLIWWRIYVDGKPHIKCETFSAARDFALSSLNHGGITVIDAKVVDVFHFVRTVLLNYRGVSPLKYWSDYSGDTPFSYPLGADCLYFCCVYVRKIMFFWVMHADGSAHLKETLHKNHSLYRDLKDFAEWTDVDPEWKNPLLADEPTEAKRARVE